MDRATLAKRRPTTVSSCDVRQSTGGERLHHLSQFFSVVSGLSCEMDEMYGIPSQFTFAKKHLSHFDKPDIIYHSDITYIRRRWEG
jgi:hypothetical protein